VQPWIEGKHKDQTLLTQVRLMARSAAVYISKEAANWHEPMIPRHIMWPSTARISKQLKLSFAASRHTTTLISHTRP